MKQLFAAACAAMFLSTCACAQTVGPDLRYSHKSTFGVFANYSGDSSHIILGQELNRKIAGLGASYSRRIVGNKNAEFSYELEVRPLTFVRDPVVSGDVTVTLLTSPPGVVELPFTGHFAGPTLSDCKSGTTTIMGISEDGLRYSQTTTQQCGSRWTYAGGISPLGLRFSFAKRHRLQPYLVANAGFLVSPHDIPVNLSNNFNFTFEGGGGIEWFTDHRHSWAADFRLHHLSNNYTGYYNPGIDSGVMRLSYRFGR